MPRILRKAAPKAVKAPKPEMAFNKDLLKIVTKHFPHFSRDLETDARKNEAFMELFTKQAWTTEWRAAETQKKEVTEIQIRKPYEHEMNFIIDDKAISLFIYLYFTIQNITYRNEEIGSFRSSYPSMALTIDDLPITGAVNEPVDIELEGVNYVLPKWVVALAKPLTARQKMPEGAVYFTEDGQRKVAAVFGLDGKLEFYSPILFLLEKVPESVDVWAKQVDAFKAKKVIIDVMTAIRDKRTVGLKEKITNELNELRRLQQEEKLQQNTPEEVADLIQGELSESVEKDALILGTYINPKGEFCAVVGPILSNAITQGLRTGAKQLNWGVMDLNLSRRSAFHITRNGGRINPHLTGGNGNGMCMGEGLAQFEKLFAGARIIESIQFFIYRMQHPNYATGTQEGIGFSNGVAEDQEAEFVLGYINSTDKVWGKFKTDEEIIRLVNTPGSLKRRAKKVAATKTVAVKRTRKPKVGLFLEEIPF